MAGKRVGKTSRRAVAGAAVSTGAALKAKEKKEILFIIGIVVVIAVIGLVLTQIAANRASAIAGAAIRPNAELPTYAGLFSLLQEAEVVSGVGTCSFLCGARTCIPVEESCTIYRVRNDCLCVSPPTGGGIGESSYEELIALLQEAEVVREEGICNTICSSREMACLFADGGARTCEEVASQCTCR